MEQGLARVGEFLQMDRITLLELSRDRGVMTVAYSWNHAGVAAPLPVLTTQMQPWWVGQVLRGDVTLAAHVDDLPEEAAAEREYLRQRGIASVASIPLKVGGEIAGAISFVTTRRYVTWTPTLVNELRAISDILWNALKRHQAMRALVATEALARDNEERFRLAMNTVAAGVYTTDLQGAVTYMNPAAEVMFGWTMGELLGRKMHDTIHYKHPDGAPYPASDCPGFQVLQKGIELREHADVFIRKDGSFFPVVFSASPLKRDGRTVGIVVALRDDTQRRVAERAMRESEERFRLIASTVPVIIWMSDVDQRCTYVNESWTTLLGRSREDALGRGWADGIHPDDIERSVETYANALARREPFQVEHRLRTSDAEFRWFLVQATPRYTTERMFAGYIGSAVDVTERKAAEAALSTLSQRLIRAQEQERARLARELHDDINQQLALLAMRLDALKLRSQASAPELEPDIAKAIDAVVALTTDVQGLSHRLHSSKLMLLGLEAAARHLCRELSDRLSIDIHFESKGVVAVVEEDVSVGLYRVLQEALQNAIKHSGSRRVDVLLQGSSHEITLTVQDSGIGFEPNTALSGRGLGLISMKERLKLVDGELRVDTRSPGGTTIRARVPIKQVTQRSETV
jgi:PAS domain S-box-containing protein